MPETCASYLLPSLSTTTFYILPAVRGCWLCLSVSGLHLSLHPSDNALVQAIVLSSLGDSSSSPIGFPDSNLAPDQFFFGLKCGQNNLFKLEIVSGSSLVSSPLIAPQDSPGKAQNH